MKSDMDFMKKIALGQDNDLSDLISGLLNEDPEARMTLEQALTNPFIDKAVKKLKP